MRRKISASASAGALAIAMVFVTQGASADTITPDIIFGTDNTNRGFTVSQVGSLELGLRAKLRNPSPNDAIGTGIVQDIDGNYLFDSNPAVEGLGQAVWSYDWSINSNFNGAGSGLDAFSYEILVDTDPTVNSDFTNISYDPLSALSTGYYLGTNTTGNGAASFIPAGTGDGDFSSNNVAQNSVQPQWVAGALASTMIGSGQFSVLLRAYDNLVLVGEVGINAIVDAPAPIPLPAAAWLFLSALAGGAGFKKLRGRRETRPADLAAA